MPKRTVKSCGPDASEVGVKSQRRSRKPDRAGVPNFVRRRGQESPIPRGERDISRKAIAQGMSDCLRCPVCSCAHLFVHMHARPRVQRASGIPCALCILGGESYLQTSGASRRENAEPYLSAVIASAAKQSILPFARRDGLLRFARNDGKYDFAFSRRIAPESCK